LIETAGLKAFRIGGAQVSPKHANFIVNVGGATAADLEAVIRHVQAQVLQQFGVQLRTEVVFLGPWT
jgi:UDP-N-acetylmuramate dehydrogenase